MILENSDFLLCTFSAGIYPIFAKKLLHRYCNGPDEVEGSA
jgi:hypothetical protein